MLWNFLVSFLNALIKGLAFVLKSIVSILPPSPFQLIDNTVVSDYLGGLAWLVPIPSILSILEFWLIAISVYYVQMVILRWIKAIE